MSIKVGIDFGTSNSGVAVYDGQRVQLLAVDPKNVLPEVIKTVLYITKDYRASIGQEAVENYYRDNVNRQRRYVKQWAGEIDVRGADMFYVRDIYVFVDELKPGRLLQYLKTALRKDGYAGTQIFERYYTVGDLAKTYLSLLKKRAENVLGESIEAVTLGRPVKFSESPEQDHKAQETLREAAYESGFKGVDFIGTHALFLLQNGRRARPRHRPRRGPGRPLGPVCPSGVVDGRTRRVLRWFRPLRASGRTLARCARHRRCAARRRHRAQRVAPWACRCHRLRCGP